MKNYPKGRSQSDTYPDIFYKFDFDFFVLITNSLKKN